MRVLCISKDEPGEPHPDLIIAAAMLIVGEIYTVVDEWKDMYELEEFPHYRKIYWKKKYFCPLSAIDEAETVWKCQIETI